MTRRWRRDPAAGVPGGRVLVPRADLRLRLLRAAAAAARTPAGPTCSTPWSSSPCAAATARRRRRPHRAG